METIKDYTEEMQEAHRNIISQIIIDDIFNIAQGAYKNYNDYVNIKQRIIEDFRKLNNSCLMVSNNKYTFTYYVEPLIITKHDFDYIISKYKR